MHQTSLFYYPYASFTSAQLPLLKVAALYFDKLALLDPVGASWDSIGADPNARDGVRQLKDADILEIVTPAAVLAQFETAIAAAIRCDMRDRDFLDLCEAHGRSTGRHRWTLSLAKVPQDLESDQTMRKLMGEFAREVARESGQYQEGLGGDSGEYLEYAESGQAYDEYREGDGGGVEYRYADFPLALGEAIMMNHALFAGLLHGATPITDVPFHSQALALKLKRCAQEPEIQKAIAERTSSRHIKSGALSSIALMDGALKLPILNPATPLAEVLEYRNANPEALARVRETLGLMAQRIQAEPWSDEFEREIEARTLPDLVVQLREAARARDAWLNSQRSKQWLSAAGIALGAASAVLGAVATPVTPIALVTAGLGLASGSAIPAVQWLLDWQAGKKAGQENGLHYLLSY